MWQKKPLRDMISYISKGIPPKYAEYETDSTIRVLNQKCNRDFEISYDESRLHDISKPVPTEKILRIGDVLINSTGAGTAGRVAQVLDLPCATTVDGHMIILRSKDGIDSLYFGYAIKRHQAQIETLAEGSTGQTEINKRRLQDEIIISYPEEIEQQRRIAQSLLYIDNKIKLNNAINHNLAA